MKKGISLITLIITIVIIIILAGVLILNLNDNNPIEMAKISNLISTKDTLQDSIFLYNTNIITKEATSSTNNTYSSDSKNSNLLLGVNSYNKYGIVLLKDSADESNYSLEDIQSTIIKKDGKNIILYKLDKNKCKKNEIKINDEPDENCSWYITENGKVYLVYDENAKMLNWIKGNPLPGKLVENATLNEFVVMISYEDKNPTIHDLVKECPANMFSYASNNDGTVSITGLNDSYEGEIPEQIKFPTKNQEGKNIVKISNGAFSSVLQNVKTLVVTEGIEEIGIGAFSYCTSLEEIYIPSTIKKVNPNVLQGENSLKKITIPNILVSSSNTNTNPSNWFSYSKSSITEVKFSDEITAIGSNAFSSFTALASIELPDTVQSIGTNAFSGCSSLSGKITIGSKVETIGNSAFNGCINIEEYDFSNAKSLTKIDTGAFNQNKLVKKLILNEGIEEIGAGAFNYCTSLEEIYIPSTIKKVNSNILQGENSLKKITIPNILVSSSDKNTNPSNWFSYSKSSITEVKFSDEITAIGSNAFSSFTALESIELPDTVQSIGANAFSGCEKIEEYDFSNAKSLTKIDTGAFNQNKLVKKLILNEGLEEIGVSAFNYCTSLEEIYIPSTIKKVNSNILQGVNSLKKITIPNILVSSSDKNTNPSNWFSYSKSSITEVKFSDEITAIGSNAFSSFTALESIELPDTVQSIGANAFSGCSALTCIKYKGSASGAPWGAKNATVVTDF